MAIDLLAIQPHKVSRDLSGYITFIYGPPKVGKTTFGSKFPNALICAFERGYNALPGIIAQDILSWSDFRQVVSQLKKPEVKNKYKSVIIDTADIAANLCQKYICNKLDIDNIGDGGWSNNGWDKYKKELESTFRTITQLGYAVLFISHDKEKTIKPKDTNEYQQIGSSMQSSALSIIENMSDIIGYAHLKRMENGIQKTVLTLRADNSVRCGCRFKYIESEIDFTYEALEKALCDAIDKEASETNNMFVTTESIQPIKQKEYDFDAMMKEFENLVGELMTENQSNATKITAIADKYLGKGKKVAECTPTQCEQLELILIDLKELIK